MAEPGASYPAGEEPPPPLPTTPILTRTEKVVWAAFGLVAVLLAVLPATRHRFTLADAGAVVLLLGAVTISFIWFRNGELRTAEWLDEQDYEQFLTEVRPPPRSHSGPGSD